MSVKPYRSDCEERYEAIKTAYDFKDKSVIDIGCANGYFLLRFLEDGAKSLCGIEPDEQYAEEFILRNISKTNDHYDVCLYLDLHYHNSIDYLSWIKSHCDVAFIAPSGVGNNKKLEEDLIKEFGNFEFIINTAYANRNIYKVIINAIH
jgi:hypothetical protein